MLVDVVFLSHGGMNPLRFEGRWFAWRERAGSPIELEKWEMCALKLVERAKAGKFEPVEVFLCFKTEDWTDLFDHDFTGRLVSAARNHGWGGNVYVAISSGMGPLRNVGELREEDALNEYIASLQKWFQQVVEAGATDIIQADINTSEEARIWEDDGSLKQLRAGADRSEKRQQALRAEAEWSGILPADATALGLFLEPFDIHYLSELPRGKRGNWVTVIDSGLPDKQIRFLNDAAVVYPDQQIVAAVRPLGELRRMEREGHHRIARYRGWFELRYLFHLLEPGPLALADRKEGRADEVPVLETASFADAGNGGQRPSILLTNSFAARKSRNSRWHVLNGALEIGQSVLRKPAHTEYVVSPAAGCDTLAEAIARLPPDLTAWLHVGHGEDGRGLKDAAGKFKPIHDWLECFRGHTVRNGSLALAVFSACETVAIARRFAQEGVGVAIGFEKPVDGDVCRHLTAPVISAALRSGGDRETILRAYHAGCADLRARNQPDPKPVAFFSKR